MMRRVVTPATSPPPTAATTPTTPASRAARYCQSPLTIRVPSSTDPTNDASRWVSTTTSNVRTCVRKPSDRFDYLYGQLRKLPGAKDNIVLPSSMFLTLETSMQVFTFPKFKQDMHQFFSPFGILRLFDMDTESEQFLLRILYKILSILVWFEECGIIHCDVKLENIVWDGKDPQSIRFIDLEGCCAWSTEFTRYLMIRDPKKTSPYTETYAPPELIPVKTKDNLTQWEPQLGVSDLYSSMSSINVPFDHYMFGKRFKVFTRDVSDELKKVFEGALRTHPHDRLEPKQALQIVGNLLNSK